MKRLLIISIFLGFSGCVEQFGGSASNEAAKPRLVMFIGADISGSFLKGRYFDDSLNFLAHYIYGHINGMGGLEVPHALFVGSIGGDKPNEPKTLYPIEEFRHASIKEIRTKLGRIFPKKRSNPFTDYNAFFKQVSQTVKNRKLLLKPVSIVMISDGKPDVPGTKGEKGFRAIKLKPLEQLSRNITLRVLYTDAVRGMGWQSKVPRKRVKVWTQDAAVMLGWRNKKVLQPGVPFAKQKRFFNWVQNNVDFGVRAQRVN